MVGIREPRTPTDHRMFLGGLIGKGVTRHHTYVKVKTTWPIHEEKGSTRQEVSSQFRDLKSRFKKPSRKDRTTLAPWISDTTCNVEDQRTALGRKCISNQGERRVLMRRLQAALKDNRRCRVGRVWGRSIH